MLQVPRQLMMICKVMVHRLSPAMLDTLTVNYNSDLSQYLSDALSSPGSSPIKLIVNTRPELKACPLSKRLQFNSSLIDGGTTNMTKLLRKCRRCSVKLVDCMKSFQLQPNAQPTPAISAQPDGLLDKIETKHRKKEKKREKHKVNNV